jgi:hypothetical protein
VEQLRRWRAAENNAIGTRIKAGVLDYVNSCGTEYLPPKAHSCDREVLKAVPGTYSSTILTGPNAGLTQVVDDR